MLVDAYAKINWTLDVTGSRPNGYHDLDTIMQSVSLCDTLDIERSDTINVLVDCKGVPNGTANLAHRAAEAYFSAAGITGGAHIHITKRIPSAAGLGGGSTDAAAVLRALEKLYVPLGEQRMRDTAVSIGADVTFCLDGGLARATGIGEILEKHTSVPMWLLLVKPSSGVPTKDVFDRLRLPLTERPRTGEALKALCEGDAKKLSAFLFNALEPVAAQIVPEIAKMKRELARHGALGASMTGSGSCVFGVFESERDAQNALIHFEHYDFSMVCQTRN